MSAQDEPTLAPSTDETEPSGFDVVLRGYDRRQVDDYLDRVEVALHEADQRHADDGARVTAVETELAEMRSRLEAAEQRAAGRPEPASLVGQRIADMLALAEQETQATRAGAREEADRLVAQAREHSMREHAERTGVLEQREREVAGAAAEADGLRLEAQRDAELLRDTAGREAEQLTASARQDADEVMRQAQESARALTAQAQQQAEHHRAEADEDVRRRHDAGRAEAAAMTSEARRQVEDLSRHRDQIARQLAGVQEAVGAALGVVSAPEGDPRAAAGQGSPERSSRALFG